MRKNKKKKEKIHCMPKPWFELRLSPGRFYVIM